MQQRLNMNLQELERNVIEVCGEVGDFIYSESSDFDRSRIEQKMVSTISSLMLTRKRNEDW